MKFYNENPKKTEDVIPIVLDQMDELHEEKERALRSPDARVRNTMLISLCDFEQIDIPQDGVDVYGASWIGHFLHDKAGDILKIGCYIDRKADSAGKHIDYYQGIPVVHMNQYQPQEGRTVLIIPTYDMEQIQSMFRERFPNQKLRCIGIDRFLENGIPIEKRKELGM